MVNYRLSLTLALVASLASGCSDKKKPTVDRTKVTIASTDNATQDLIDEDYRFRIRWPGKGWKLIGESDMRKLSPDAVAGAVSDKHVWGAIIVERFTDDDIESFARLIVDGMPLEGKEIETQESARFAGQKATRFVLRGRISGMNARYAGYVFGYQGHVYQVMSWSQDSILDATGRQAQPFFDGFSLLDGPVTGREQVVTTHDSQGPGWQVRKGGFTSAAHQFRIRPPSGWRVAVGSELFNINAEAEVALIASNPELYITVMAELSATEDEQALLHLTQNNVAQAFEKTSPGEPMTLAIAGKERTFQRTIVDQPPFEFLTTGFLHHGEWFQIQAWYLAALSQADKDRVLQGLRAIEFLSPEDSAQARADMVRAVDGQNAVGPAYSLRRGHYRDFEHDWTWRKPDTGFWRILVGQEARSKAPNARLYLEEAGTSIYMHAGSGGNSGLSLNDFASSLKTELEAMGVSVRAQRQVALGDSSGLILVGNATLQNGAQAEYRALAAVGADGTTLRADAWGGIDAMKQHHAMVEAAMTSFRFHPDSTPTSSDGQVFRDVRMGFSLRMEADWRRTTKTPSTLAGIGSATEWKNGQREVFILSLCALEANHDQEWFFDFMEQRVRENFGNSIAGEPDKSVIEMAGEPARKLVWKRGLQKRLYAYLVRRDATLYMVMGSNLTSAEAGALPERFEFID